MAQAFAIDTNIFDKLEADLVARRAFTAPARPMRVLVTHVQEDQLKAIPDPRKRDRLLALLAHTEMVPTNGFVLDVSKLDGPSHLAGEDVGEIIDRVGRVESSKRHLERLKDALLVTTALRDGATLVTEDQQLSARALRDAPGLVVWTWEPFRAALVDAPA